MSVAGLQSSRRQAESLLQALQGNLGPCVFGSQGPLHSLACCPCPPPANWEHWLESVSHHVTLPSLFSGPPSSSFKDPYDYTEHPSPRYSRLIFLFQGQLITNLMMLFTTLICPCHVT